MIKLVIIDDDSLVCHALKTILEASGKVSVEAIGNDGSHALELFETTKPDILLMDIRMANVTGIEAGRILLEKYPTAKILYLTTFADNEYIIDALKIGAKGYLLKQDFESLLPAIEAVSIGQRVFGDEIISKLPDMMSSSSKTDFSAFGLNEKEIEILIKVADGLSNKEIASETFLGEGTIRNYISIILEKLQLRDRTQLAIFYYKNI